MKTTTTIHNFILSELLNNGFNLYQDNHQIMFYNNLISQKIIKYDDDVKFLLEKTIFYGLSDVSLTFKKSFLARFENRVIRFQTIDLFSVKLFSFIFPKISYINNLFDNAENFMKEKSISNNNAKSTTLSKDNSLFADLPQTETNINLDVEGLPFATTTDLSKSKNENISENNSENNSFNIENLTLYNEEVNKLFIELDIELFSQLI